MGSLFLSLMVGLRLNVLEVCRWGEIIMGWGYRYFLGDESKNSFDRCFECSCYF